MNQLNREELKEILRDMFQDGEIELKLFQSRFGGSVSAQVLIDGEVVAVSN